MLQDVLLPGQTHKNTVNYSVSAFETRWKPSRTTNKVKPKNGQIGGVFVFFEHSRSKKLRKNRVFFDASQAQNHGICGVFSKNHGIYSALWPERSKNSGIYAVFSMLQDVLLPRQTHKNTVNYSVLAFETRWKPSKTTNKCPKWSISFGPKKQKQWYLRSFQHVARRTFARPNAQKHRKLQCFGIWNPMKTVKNHQQGKAEKWSNRWCFRVFWTFSEQKTP